MTYDIIIAGAGPAGSYAAYIAARRGLRTLLLEKQKMPRPKPCGGAVSQKALEFLDFSIEAVAVNKIFGASFACNHKDEFIISLEQPFCWLVRRDQFDHYLAQKAVEAGAEFVDGCPVVDFGDENGEIKVKSSSGEFTGRFFIAADGVNGKAGRRFKKYHKIGITLEGETARDGWIYDISSRQGGDRNIYVDCGVIEKGYGWVFPRGERLAAGLGTFKPKDSAIKEKMDSFARQQGVKVEKVYGYPIPLYTPGKKNYHHGQCLVVGDAAGLVDPLSGEGIYFALKSGALAAESVINLLEGRERDIRCYTERINREVTPALKRANLLSKVFYGFPVQVHRLLKANERLAQEFLQLVYGNGNYGQVYKALLKGLLLPGHAHNLPDPG